MRPIRVVGLTTVDDSARARRSSPRIWIWPVMADQAVGAAEETMCSIECQRSQRGLSCIPHSTAAADLEWTGWLRGKTPRSHIDPSARPSRLLASESRVDSMSYGIPGSALEPLPW